MRKINELEKRIKMLECAVNRGHSYYNGIAISRSGRTGYVDITLKCLYCDYELTKPASELSEKEKEAAIRLGLIPKEQESNDSISSTSKD